MPKRRSTHALVRPTTPEAARAAIIAALQALAGVCDYARTRDDVGFNGPDAALGHALADYSLLGHLTTQELMIAYRMLRKYERTQLAKLEPPIILPGEAAVIALAGRRCDLANVRYTGAIRVSNGALIVSFPYAPDKTHRIGTIRRKHGGNGWTKNGSGYSGFWHLALTAIHDLCAAFPEFELTDGAAFLRDQMPESPPPAPAAAHVPAPLQQPRRIDGVITVQDGQIAIQLMAAFNQHNLVRIKRLLAQYGGLGFDGTTRRWRLNPAAAAALADIFSTFDVDEEAATIIATTRANYRNVAS